MKKRLISTLLVAAMAVSLVACGGGDKKDAAKKSDSESKKSTNTDVLNINVASEPAYLDPALNQFCRWRMFSSKLFRRSLYL